MICEACKGTGANQSGKPCWECNGTGSRCDVCGEACDAGADRCADCQSEPVCADCGSDLNQVGHCKAGCADAERQGRRESEV
jgi:hypothetical protein